MAIKDYNGSDPTSKLLASINNNGFMSTNDKKTLNSLSNDNLLINGSLQVWQRGTSFTINNNSSITYTADMWRVFNTNSSTCTIEKVSNGLQITGNSSPIIVHQILSTETLVTGEKYTLSASINNKIYSLTFTAGIANQPMPLEYYFGSANKHEIGIQLKANDILNWVKLEHGEVVTPYVKPLYTDELEKCAPYGVQVYICSSMHTWASNNEYNIIMHLPYHFIRIGTVTNFKLISFIYGATDITSKITSISASLSNNGYEYYIYIHILFPSSVVSADNLKYGAYLYGTAFVDCSAY